MGDWWNPKPCKSKYNDDDDVGVTCHSLMTRHSAALMHAAYNLLGPDTSQPGRGSHNPDISRRQRDIDPKIEILSL